MDGSYLFAVLSEVISFLSDKPAALLTKNGQVSEIAA